MENVDARSFDEENVVRTAAVDEYKGRANQLAIRDKEIRVCGRSTDESNAEQSASERHWNEPPVDAGYHVPTSFETT